MIQYDETPNYFIDTRPRSHTMPSMHYHSSYELYYLLAGNREYFVEDKFFSVTAGSFVLIPPSTLHRTGGKCGLRTLIGFSDKFLKDVYNEQVISDLVKCFKNYMITPPENKRAELQELLKKIEVCNNKTDFAIYLGALLRELSKYKSNNECDEYISNITSYINKNYAQIQSIDQIAEHFYISKYHLCRIFKDALKMTLIDYINGIKIKSACAFIQSSNKDMLEIAQLCGFNSSSYFCIVFKKIVGKSPSEYKKSIKTNKN